MPSPTAVIRPAVQAAFLLTVMITTTGVVSAQAVGPAIPIWVDTVNSFRPAVAFDIIHEEYLVVWFNEQGPDSVDVYARRVAMDGSPGSWFSVISAAGAYFSSPTVAYNQVRDEYLVAWEFEYAPDDIDIWGSLISWNGGSIGTPFVINGDLDAQRAPDLAFNPNDDEYLLVYQNEWAGGLRDIAAQRVDGDGSLLSWANIATSSSGVRYSPRVEFSPELAKYLIGYSRDPNGMAIPDVAGKTAAPDLAGVSAAPEITIIDGSVHWAINPAVGAGAESFITQFNMPTDVRARRLAADGTPLGPTSGFLLATNPAMTQPSHSNAVARSDAVGFVSAFQVFGSNYADIYAQVVSPHSDRVLSGEFTVAVNNVSNHEVDIACAPWGTCLIVYQSDGNIEGKVIRLNLFGDDFEVGDTRNWSGVIP